MKQLIWTVGFTLIAGITSWTFAAQVIELDGTMQWHNTSHHELHNLSLQSSGLKIAGDYQGQSASFTSPIIKTPFPFTALGAHWRVTTSGNSKFELFVSTSVDGHTFGPFRLITADPHLDPTQYLSDGNTNPRHGETMGQLYLHPRSDGQFFRYRITLSRDPTKRVSPLVERLGFTVINTEDHINARNTRASKLPAAKTITNNYPKPPVVSRNAWGARSATCNYAYCTTTHIGVHHTASVSDYSCSGFSECAAVIRAVQTFHMDSNGWCDLGYNYLATPDGTLWEGRGGGDDVRGAHDGHNCGSMGVSNVGYFHAPFNHLWTAAQQDAVAELSAWKSSMQNIDPFGIDFYAGLGAFNDNIYGHRDVSSTACPGDNVYDFLPDLRSLVSFKLSSEEQQFVLDTDEVNIVTGNWTTGTSSTDKYGTDYLWTSTGGAQICGWKLDIDGPGLYEVALWWPAGSNRSPKAQVFVKRTRDDYEVTVDQRINGGQWNTIGAFQFERGNITIGVTNNAPSGAVVMCDALRLMPLD